MCNYAYDFEIQELSIILIIIGRYFTVLFSMLSIFFASDLFIKKEAISIFLDIYHFDVSYLSIASGITLILSTVFVTFLSISSLSYKILANILITLISIVAALPVIKEIFGVNMKSIQNKNLYFISICLFFLLTVFDILNIYFKKMDLNYLR